MSILDIYPVFPYLSLLSININITTTEPGTHYYQHLSISSIIYKLSIAMWNFPEGKFPPKKTIGIHKSYLTSIFTTIVTIALKPHVGFQPLNILHQSSYNPIKSPLITIKSLFISYRTRFIVYSRIQLQHILSLFWWIQFITLLYQYVHQIDTIRYIIRCILVITIFHSDMLHFSDQYI